LFASPSLSSLTQANNRPNARSINQPMQNCNCSKEHGRESWWAIRRAKKSPLRSPAIHSIFTATRTFGLRRQLHCLQAKTQSSYTPLSKVVHHHRLIASAKLSEPSSILRTRH